LLHVADIPSLKAWAGVDEVKITIYYDSTGNGNHNTQTNANLQQVISNYGGVQLYEDNLVFRENNSFDMTSGGTNTPIGANRLDVYSTFEVTGANTTAFRLVYSRRVNNTYMLAGASGSASTNISSNFGSPSYFIDGSAATWSNLGDVYTELFDTGKHQITILDGDTTNSGWAVDFRIGKIDLNYEWYGSLFTVWVWVDDTSSDRTAIEAKLNALDAINLY
jgi:hypothetical protein